MPHTGRFPAPPLACLPHSPKAHAAPRDDWAHASPGHYRTRSYAADRRVGGPLADDDASRAIEESGLCDAPLQVKHGHAENRVG